MTQKLHLTLRHRVTGEKATLENSFPDSESAIKQIDIWKKTVVEQGYDIVDYSIDTHLGNLKLQRKDHCLVHADRQSIAMWSKSEKTKDGIQTAHYKLTMCKPCFDEFTGKDPKPRERLMTLAIDQFTLKPEEDP